MNNNFKKLPEGAHDIISKRQAENLGKFCVRKGSQSKLLTELSLGMGWIRGNLYFYCLNILQFVSISLYIYEVKRSEVAQSCSTLCDPMDCSLPGSSLHGIFQARKLEWGAISFSRGTSQHRDPTHTSYIPSTGRWVLHQYHLESPKGCSISITR